jgi:hypothetical protein
MTDVFFNGVPRVFRFTKTIPNNNINTLVGEIDISDPTKAYVVQMQFACKDPSPGGGIATERYRFSIQGGPTPVLVAGGVIFGSNSNLTNPPLMNNSIAFTPGGRLSATVQNPLAANPIDVAVDFFVEISP